MVRPHYFINTGGQNVQAEFSDFQPEYPDGVFPGWFGRAH
jgi:hypothetical protein